MPPQKADLLIYRGISFLQPAGKWSFRFLFN